MTEIVSVLFLIISVVSLIVQSIALYRMTRDVTTRGPAYAGLLRTALCRVAASVLYTMLGIATLIDPVVVESLLVFGVVQVMWQMNAIADVALRHRIQRGAPRHRRPVPPATPAVQRTWFGVALLVSSLAFVGYLMFRH